MCLSCSVESMLDLVIEIWPLEESPYLLLQWKFQKVWDILFSGEICADKRSLSTSYQMIDQVASHKRSSSNDGMNLP